MQKYWRQQGVVKHRKRWCLSFRDSTKTRTGVLSKCLGNHPAWLPVNCKCLGWMNKKHVVCEFVTLPSLKVLNSHTSKYIPWQLRWTMETQKNRLMVERKPSLPKHPFFQGSTHSFHNINLRYHHGVSCRCGPLPVMDPKKTVASRGPWLIGAPRLYIYSISQIYNPFITYNYLYSRCPLSTETLHTDQETAPQEAAKAPAGKASPNILIR